MSDLPTKPTQIDLADPEDIRLRLPDLEIFVKAKYDDWEKWDSLLDTLATAAGVKREKPGPTAKKRTVELDGQEFRRVNPPKRRTKKNSVQATVVKIVNDTGGALTVAAVAEKLPDVKRETVGWSLWKASEDDELQKVAQGTYAPLDYQSSNKETLLSSSQNGASAQEDQD